MSKVHRNAAFYYMQSKLWDRIGALIRDCGVALMGQNHPQHAPGIGFVMVKCHELDKITADGDMLSRQLWQADRDFVELADAFLVPAGAIDR